ncbi:MAG: hypothetical protein HZA54_10770, partial [Planctomycetes bacterium]|nr:hypothetical protein [Planctomycetota bacterium]
MRAAGGVTLQVQATGYSAFAGRPGVLPPDDPWLALLDATAESDADPLVRRAALQALAERASRWVRAARVAAAAGPAADRGADRDAPTPPHCGDPAPAADGADDSTPVAQAVTRLAGASRRAATAGERRA